jgi:acetyltransferase-like isoleucine patch superfamily enzyme
MRDPEATDQTLAHEQGQLLAEFDELVASDDLQRAGDTFLRRSSGLVDRFLGTGELSLADDPFKGQDRQLAQDSEIFYTMFWRLFDRTPAAMMQDFAIKLRRILAHKVFKQVGQDVTIHHDVLFSSGANITLGDGVFINRRVMLDDRGPLTIGDHSMLAAGVTVETHAHVFDDFSRPMPQGGRLMKPVAIGTECLIGYNAVVMAGTTVGQRAIVAANSVVTRDVADYHVVGGVPAKPIKVIAPE